MANIKLRTFKEISTQTAVFKMDIRHINDTLHKTIAKKFICLYDSQKVYLFILRFNIPVNNFSVILGWRFLCINRYMCSGVFMCLAHVHN